MQAVEIGKAIDLLRKISSEYSFSMRQQQIYKLLVASCPLLTINNNQYIDADVLKNFMLNFSKALQTKDSASLRMERGLRVKRIVDVVEFAESPEFMDQGSALRPAIRDKLWEFFHEGNYVQGVLGGGIGIGKNYFSDIAMSYMLYKLSCYISPQTEYDLAPGSSIIFIIQSKSLKLARKAAFDQLSARLKLSPYFMKYFPFDTQIKSELHFPMNIEVLPIGGSDTGALGLNVFGGSIDEMNFMARTSNSIYTKYTGEEEYDQAESLYNTLIQRMVSRFMQKGKLPGKLMLISSANYVGDFIYRMRQRAKTDPTIFVMHYAQWEALPQDRFCGEKFYVEKGTDIKPPRILQSRTRDDAESEAMDAEDILEIPIEYKPQFDMDLLDALKNLAGIESGPQHPFIPQREKIINATERFSELNGNRQLFKLSSCVIQNVLDLASPDYELLIDSEYIANNITDTGTAFAVHIDLAATQDCCGLAIGRILNYIRLKEVAKIDPETGEQYILADVEVPNIIIDGILQIVAPPGGEIDFNLVKLVVLYLKRLLNVKWVTLDTWQSRQMSQDFQRNKIRSGFLSMDSSIIPYSNLKDAIKNESILYPPHEVCMNELKQLEMDAKHGKVDHNSGGSKDCSDCVAGVTHILTTKEGKVGAGMGRQGRPASVRNVRFNEGKKEQVPATGRRRRFKVL